jgi:hypothetical protein
MSAAATHEADRSYRDVLRNRHLPRRLGRRGLELGFTSDHAQVTTMNEFLGH